MHKITLSSLPYQPSSPSLLAGRLSGRVLAAMHAFRLVLAVTHTFVARSTPTVHGAPAAGMALLMCYAVIRYQPFFKSTSNRCAAAACAVMAWIGATSVAAALTSPLSSLSEAK